MVKIASEQHHWECLGLLGLLYAPDWNRTLEAVRLITRAWARDQSVEF